MVGDILAFSEVMQVYVYSLVSGFGLAAVLGFTVWGVVSVVRLFSDAISGR